MSRAVVVRPADDDDVAGVRRLVAAAGLPLDGLADAAVTLVAVAVGGAGGAGAAVPGGTVPVGAVPVGAVLVGTEVVGAVALERHGEPDAPVFLLRSAVVDPAWQGRGVGARLTAAALDVVDRHGAPAALLTETAREWFPRFGFGVVPRGSLPSALGASAELRGACPASATAMLRPARRPQERSG